MIAKLYEMTELVIAPEDGAEDLIASDAPAVFVEPETHDEIKVRGFTSSDGYFIYRFLPLKAGVYEYRIVTDRISIKGACETEAADGSHHGPVRADGARLVYDDGSRFTSFGTTVYSMLHQSEEVFEETLRTLSRSPFNKVRLCLFPKHYPLCTNVPPCYPFAPLEGQKRRSFLPEDAPGPFDEPEARDDYWDTNNPDLGFWDMIDDRLTRLMDLGIQADLILFHPYDRWGFSNLSMEDNLRYLDYAVRRLAAYPNIWWSLSNEYDLTLSKTIEDWYTIEAFVAEKDPYHHMIGCHNWIALWDASRERTTHLSLQTRELWRVTEFMKKYRKPVMIDECKYEGNLQEDWGSLSGQEMVRSFWQVMVQGGYCTHGDTFYPEEGSEAIWWAHGGKIRGESVPRIAFLKDIADSLPGPIETVVESGLNQAVFFTGKETPEELNKMPAFLKQAWKSFRMMPDIERELFISKNITYHGHCGEDAFLFYLDDQCCIRTAIDLPEDRKYRIEVIDTWNMTRAIARTGATGGVQIELPGRPYMAILAIAE